ncbi:MAG: GIY-YIG nuclease family protein [Salibacteraceae bacterium]
MSYTVYVIRNSLTGKLYKGQTEHLEKRLTEHNQGHTKTTRGEGIWSVVYSEVFETRQEALKREKYFKSAAGRRFLKKVLSA